MSGAAVFLLLFSGILIAFGFLMLYRNNWVCEARIEMIYSDYDKFGRMESYDAMLWRWWCWDAEKFVLEGLDK